MLSFIICKMRIILPISELLQNEGDSVYIQKAYQYLAHSGYITYFLSSPRTKIPFLGRLCFSVNHAAPLEAGVL